MPSGIGASCVLKSNLSGALCDGNNLTNSCYDDGCDDIFTSNSVQRNGWTKLSGKYFKYCGPGSLFSIFKFLPQLLFY
jgi:hypothetical protein